MSTNTLKCIHEEHENMQLSPKPAPNGLPLQGSGGFSQASLDLSSLKGCLASEKMQENKRKEEKITKPEGRKRRANLID